MAKFLIVIEGDDAGNKAIDAIGKELVQKASDRLRQQGFLVHSSVFERGGIDKVQTFAERRKAKDEARKAEAEVEKARVDAENAAAKSPHVRADTAAPKPHA